MNPNIFVTNFFVRDQLRGEHLKSSMACSYASVLFACGGYWPNLRRGDFHGESFCAPRTQYF